MFIQSFDMFCNYVFTELIILIERKNDSIVGFVLLHLCLKTENLAFNKKQFNAFVFAFDLKCSKSYSLLKLFKFISHLK